MYTFKKRHEIWILRRIWHPKTYSDVKLEGYKLSRQTYFYKKIHPEQFSDSTMVRVGSLDKDFFDFYLESLTSKGLEKEFEKFCRYIAEAEICPNLLPQTGPTGGGDSKVDSETYPVAESISELWYHGDGNKAGTERWAFAISAKRDWKPKVKSDVTKIMMNIRKQGELKRHETVRITKQAQEALNSVDNGQTMANSGVDRTVRNEEPKIGRNDPCPCGSGKKYKNCCGKNA